MTGAEGRTAVVVGASSGMGRGVARRLVAEGATVVAAARRRDALEGLTAECGPALVPIVADVGKDEDVEAVFDAASGLDAALSWVVNTAGVVHYGDFADQSTRAWREMVDINLLGAARVCAAALRRLLPRGEGRIVQVTSVAASLPVPGLALYSASKAGASRMLAALRGEYGSSGVGITELEVGATAGTGMGRTIEHRPPEMVERMMRFAGADRRMEVDDVVDVVWSILTAPAGARLDHVRLREPSDIPT